MNAFSQTWLAKKMHLIFLDPKTPQCSQFFLEPSLPVAAPPLLFSNVIPRTIFTQNMKFINSFQSSPSKKNRIARANAFR
jgi:hypothetical protein